MPPSPKIATFFEFYTGLKIVLNVFFRSCNLTNFNPKLPVTVAQAEVQTLCH